MMQKHTHIIFNACFDFLFLLKNMWGSRPFNETVEEIGELKTLLMHDSNSDHVVHVLFKWGAKSSPH